MAVAEVAVTMQKIPEPIDEPTLLEEVVAIREAVAAAGGTDWANEDDPVATLLRDRKGDDDPR